MDENEKTIERARKALESRRQELLVERELIEKLLTIYQTDPKSIKKQE